MKKFHKSKVDGLKKLSTRAHLFHDLLHFRGCLFTKPQFSQGALNRIHFFHIHIHFSLPHIPRSLRIKIRNCLFFWNYFQRIAIVKESQMWQMYQKLHKFLYLKKIWVLLWSESHERHNKLLIFANLADSLQPESFFSL